MIRKLHNHFLPSAAKIGGALSAALFFASLLSPVTAFATSPIAIGSCQELQKIGNDISYPLDGSYELSNNIDCTTDTTAGGALYNSGHGFQPLGPVGNPFLGTLDGKGYAIYGLHISRPAESDVGLFANSHHATVENIHFIGGSITGYLDVGTVAGQEHDLTLTNVTSNLAISDSGGDTGYFGGLIGINKQSDSTGTHISNSFFSGSITVSNGGGEIGGLIGENDDTGFITESGVNATISCDDTVNYCAYVGGLDGDSNGALTISKSFAYGSVSAGDATVNNSDSVGGLVGWSNGLTMSDSFAANTVSAHNFVGGLVGTNASSSATITNSYAVGAVSATSGSGGLVGYYSDNLNTGSFWDIDTTGQIHGCQDGDSCHGGTGLSDTEMKNKTNFTDTDWDFDHTWVQSGSINSGYPFLQWASQTSSENSATGKNAELVVPAGCFVHSMEMESAASNASADKKFSYPAGMMNFSLSCHGTGYTIPITQYIFGAKNQTYEVRKYNPSDNAYATVSGATVSFVSMNGQSAAKITYSITDGGTLDNDGKANGVIVDPVGLAVAKVTVPAAPNTGLGQPFAYEPIKLLTISSAVVTGILAAFIAVKFRATQ